MIMKVDEMFITIGDKGTSLIPDIHNIQQYGMSEGTQTVGSLPKIKFGRRSAKTAFHAWISSTHTFELYSLTTAVYKIHVVPVRLTFTPTNATPISGVGYIKRSLIGLYRNGTGNPSQYVAIPTFEWEPGQGSIESKVSKGLVEKVAKINDWLILSIAEWKTHMLKMNRGATSDAIKGVRP